MFVAPPPPDSEILAGVEKHHTPLHVRRRVPYPRARPLPPAIAVDDTLSVPDARRRMYPSPGFIASLTDVLQPRASAQRAPRPIHTPLAGAGECIATVGALITRRERHGQHTTKAPSFIALDRTQLLPK
ncbi:hypothetical protein MSAN_02533300 [Mycena sanguinolenta]|uniref:Uncharacterized protein n=1 Tax=Mycena sanguinolenta TaxID=230812 RepID=A0A8H6TWU1_9AGAR|nr:hypothetical protein MSAN_02533300 [Mycena sanguinolenta]